MAYEPPAFQEIERPSDPRIALYRDLRDGDLRRSIESQHGVFVAEGLRTVSALLESEWPIVSLLISSRRASADHSLTEAAANRGAQVLVASQEVLDSIAGFPVHRGVLALGARVPLPPPPEILRGTRLAVVVEGMNDHENLGAIFRNAAVLGAGAVLLDPGACDPLYRRSLRVSVGHVLRIPFSRLDPWPSSLSAIKESGFSLVALDPSATDPLRTLVADGRVALMVGNEGDGLSSAALELADHRVRVPMAPGSDSLNVATALAIGLYEVIRRRP